MLFNTAVLIMPSIPTIVGEIKKVSENLFFFIFLFSTPKIFLPKPRDTKLLTRAPHKLHLSTVLTFLSQGAMPSCLGTRLSAAP